MLICSWQVAALPNEVCFRRQRLRGIEVGKFCGGSGFSSGACLLVQRPL